MTLKFEKKKCSICNRSKGLHLFGIYNSSPDGLKSSCLSCSRKNAGERRGEARKAVYEYLLRHPCVDCGETNPVVLEFDHLNGKNMDISEMIGKGYSIKSIMKEIEKCEVVCSNHHSIRTARRANWYIYRWVEAGVGISI